ncbi:MAG: 4-(cytidine 5'-diphospho)-2-C-methyl-D-erythritol kinase [Elusimicrobiaceae bacterium]|nr:4-(cytidine 5'-diphospho)-2-C-methyl-D-erythritol kinase [Elusimicrobiaceae bacterium]
MKITRFCPAKVNLFLEVVGKRPNGYHELSTLFAKISLGDTLTVEATPAAKTEISLKITGPRVKFIPASPNNLVWRAAQQFLDYYGLQAQIDLTLDKQVPIGAGLGGGSSDAAGVLRALCEMFHKNSLDLVETAARLGADVPLFLYPDTFLKGEGIGELLTPIPCTSNLPYVVLVYPNTGVSTKDVFARMHLPTQEERLTNLSKLDKLIDVVRNVGSATDWGPLLFNRLEEYVLPFVPAVKQALERLAQLSKQTSRMSGSGSTVFALAPTKERADQIVSSLSGSNVSAFSVSFYREN